MRILTIIWAMLTAPIWLFVIIYAASSDCFFNCRDVTEGYLVALMDYLSEPVNVGVMSLMLFPPLYWLGELFVRAARQARRSKPEVGSVFD